MRVGQVFFDFGPAPQNFIGLIRAPFEVVNNVDGARQDITISVEVGSAPTPAISSARVCMRAPLHSRRADDPRAPTHNCTSFRTTGIC